MKKQELRSIYKSKRESLSPAEMAAMDTAICNNLLNGFDFSAFKIIHCFLPATSKNEVNTWLIINRLRNIYPEIQFVVPVTDFKNGTMTSQLLQKEAIISENKWGIPEPANAPIVLPQLIDLVLLPLLVVDLQGNRVGYGKGFYDKFLPTCKPNVLKIGLSYFPPVGTIEDFSETDIPLDFTISPSQKHKHSSNLKKTKH